MGHSEVFLHVGDQVRIQAPGGKWVAPLVTGMVYGFLPNQTVGLTNLPQEHSDLGNDLESCKRRTTPDSENVAISSTVFWERLRTTS